MKTQTQPLPAKSFRLPKISAVWLIVPVILLSILYWTNLPKQDDNKTPYLQSNDNPQQNGANYSHINQDKQDYRSLVEQVRENIRQNVQEEINKGQVTTASVYFELLKSGASCAYNNNNWYWPASLLKITTLIAYLKKSESQPGLMDQSIVFHRPNLDYKQNFVNDSLREGAAYTVRQLIDRLITASDNEACIILEERLNDEINKVYKDFNVDVTRGNRGQDFMSVEQYMLIFRALYNSTYLNKENSEYALDLLTHSEFDMGLRAGLPAGVKLASKFGEKADVRDLQLHECGIVYLDSQPYLIGVMTKGKGYQSMAGLMQKISHDVYEIVKSHNSTNPI